MNGPLQMHSYHTRHLTCIAPFRKYAEPKDKFGEHRVKHNLCLTLPSLNLCYINTKAKIMYEQSTKISIAVEVDLTLRYNA